MLSQLVLPEGVTIPELAQGEEADRPVVSISHIKMAAIEEEVVEGEEEEVAPGEVPVAGEESEEKPEEE